MNSQSIDSDAEIEDRIVMQIIVDAYGEEEHAMGWYYYLQDNVTFPFKAKCSHIKATSPLSLGESVEVIGMAKEDDCLHDMFVMVKWNGKNLAVPLSQLENLNVDSDTQQALDDWQYWIAQGYQF